MYTTIQKFGVSKIFLMLLKEVSYAQKSYKYSKTVILRNIITDVKYEIYKAAVFGFNILYSFDG